MKTLHGRGMGWQRDLPDMRDCTPESERIDAVLSKSAPLRKARKALPASVDLRRWCSPIEDQGELGSCTAHAAVSMMEYYERRTFGEHLDASRLFLYKVTRNLMGVKGDDGATLRETMKAMVLFGVPPEKYWPYAVRRFNEEPSAFCYSFAQSYQAVIYFRLDPPGTKPADALAAIKRHLAAELPSMFGFSVYSSIPAVGDGKGEIPFPQKGEKLEGGHAILAVGYDDKKKIGDDKGALLIRNSWSLAWGEQGYGWLPYAYVERGLADDFWSMTKQKYTDTELFK